MNDPYIDTDFCVKRLLNYYKQHKRGGVIVAFDCDDTVFDYHNKGYTYTRAIDALKRAQKLGFRLIPFTSAIPDRWDFLIEKIKSLGLVTEDINKNLFEKVGNHGKLYYNILLDDKAGLGQALEILEKTMDVIENFL